MSLPQVESSPVMPDRITIYEVGPRDGLQNEKTVLSTDLKAEFVRRLAASGLSTIETTSIVPAAWVPQMGDAPQLLESLGELGRGPDRPVLVPNERGL
ncbi:MAG: hydroxymethylglutaryl-CoA lyase, partial [Actinomycetota bacterium]|nr:hydroxymethylglutaryl-CoA lyase [Actinomycetota bacterium]